MKKFIYISLLFQFYFMSILTSESMRILNFSNNNSVQGMALNAGFQSALDKSLTSSGEQKNVAVKSERMIQLDLVQDNKDGQVVLGFQSNKLQFDNNSLTDQQLKEKRFYPELELSSNFCEDIIVPQSPWVLTERDEVYRQNDLFRDEKIDRLKMVKEEALMMFSQFISPCFDQKKYVEKRVQEIAGSLYPFELSSSVMLGKNNQANDELSSSVALGNNNQRDLESPTPSCCSEVLEILDYVDQK